MQGGRAALSDGVTRGQWIVPHGAIVYLLQRNDGCWNFWVNLVRDLALVEEERAFSEHSIPMKHFLLVWEVFQQLSFMHDTWTYRAFPDAKSWIAAVPLGI